MQQAFMNLFVKIKSSIKEYLLFICFTFLFITLRWFKQSQILMITENDPGSKESIENGNIIMFNHMEFTIIMIISLFFILMSLYLHNNLNINNLKLLFDKSLIILFYFLIISSFIEICNGVLPNSRIFRLLIDFHIPICFVSYFFIQLKKPIIDFSVLKNVYNAKYLVFFIPIFIIGSVMNVLFIWGFLAILMFALIPKHLIESLESFDVWEKRASLFVIFILLSPNFVASFYFAINNVINNSDFTNSFLFHSIRGTGGSWLRALEAVTASVILDDYVLKGTVFNPKKSVVYGRQGVLVRTGIMTESLHDKIEKLHQKPVAPVVEEKKSSHSRKKK